MLWLALLDSGVSATLAGVVMGAALPLRRERGREALLGTMERRLYPWAALGVVPLFVFFNAGLRVTDLQWNALLTPVARGVALGLILGKPAGIIGGAWIATRLGFARLPPSLTWRHMLGIGLLGGIGFTVSLFITTLAFADPGLASLAKLGILAGSTVSGAIGLAALALQPRGHWS